MKVTILVCINMYQIKRKPQSIIVMASLEKLNLNLIIEKSVQNLVKHTLPAYCSIETRY